MVNVVQEILVVQGSSVWKMFSWARMKSPKIIVVPYTALWCSAATSGVGDLHSSAKPCTVVHSRDKGRISNLLCVPVRES